MDLASNRTTPRALRVLLVEDTEERQQVLMSLYRSHAWVLVNSGRRAVTLLNAYDFDIVSLDYNLRGDLDGAAVARALEASRNREARVVIHSQNPRGASSIAGILPNAVAYPVSRMIRSNEAFKWLRSRIDQEGISYDWT